MRASDVIREYAEKHNISLSEIREEYEYDTGFETEWSRHYESKSVAAWFDDHLIGWTYWYGGGKHGDPGSIPWVEDAYFLETWEEMEPVRKFRRAACHLTNK